MSTTTSTPTLLTQRPRRLRRTPALRRLVRETALTPADLVYPVFVRPGRGEREPIPSLPGQARLTPDLLPALGRDLLRLGVPAVLLFGVPDRKDEVGSPAWDPDGPVPQAIRALKDACPDLVVITDVCLCVYTTHGHCGVVRDGEVLNDETLDLLARMALAHARAGADLVGPSAMMDGQVRALRTALDREGFSQVGILGYSAKYASAFYGPFRDAADSAPRFGDRAAYQMDPPNAREALREVLQDLEEGADIVMVKPALAYLDVVARIRPEVNAPLAVYSVSGEYAMVKASAERGWLDERRAVLEMLTAMKRAGADFILTYYAPEVARWLNEG